jgi:choline dehydrogenase-like flavoprotein
MAESHDVIVIGSGAGGGTLTRHLASASDKHPNGSAEQETR